MNVALLERLAAAGTPMSLVAEVAAEMAKAEAASDALKSRRNNDRQRKERQRSRPVTSGHVTTRDNPTPPVSPLFPSPKPLTNNPPLSPPTPDRDAGAREDCVEVVGLWNRMAKARGLPLASKLTNERRSRLTARLAEHGRDQFVAAIAKVGDSPHCLGENDRGWRASFDFLLQPTSFVKVIEGNYDRRTTAGRGGARYPDEVNGLGMKVPC